ncbi:unnamed protein product [Leptidea sinapis]|uniref:Pre-rRNA-processing protein Ipi1 N-terminal domain-containing protein n=1 Tax=Leptidea sinapis TaxID=189913 RepID=A0A5E4Q2S3_9NEOP|nr:unnamed protein product [Leptidea sinapis]
MHKTGATRYQKFLKAEKAKTKLKGKKDKELPKGTNVTKTNFKVKKIVIKEQLKKHVQSETLSTRKLNVKELLTRLSHFNTNSRTDALDGLREIISSDVQILEQSLGPVIQGVTALILNVEKVVRQAALKVLHLVLSNVSSEKIEPFYDVMSTYLRSAMTHIDNRIQEDSLLFLDILLLCASDKAARDFHKIIPNFLDMISKLKTDKPGRTLTVNLNSQITSVKWRVKVLNRLKDFLIKFANYKTCESKNIGVKVTKRFNASNGSNYFALFNSIYVSNCYISCFSTKSSDVVIHINEVVKFEEYIEMLMPLLIETWLEACPSLQANKKMETVISEDAGLLLKHTLEVISTIWHLVQFYNCRTPSSNIENKFCQRYRQLFAQNICSSFPYVTNVRNKQMSTTDPNFEDVLTDPKLIKENLTICHLYIMLNPNVSVKNHGNEVSAVLDYLSKNFDPKSSEYINKLILDILYETFHSCVNGWTKTASVLDPIFIKILNSYMRHELPDELQHKIFSLLCEISLNDNLNHFHSNYLFQEWLKDLPNILLGKSVTKQTVETIHKLATTKNKTFNTVFKPKLFNIIQNLPSITISDSNEVSSDYDKLLSLLYWIKVWDTESLNLLEKQLLMDNVYKSDHEKYLYDTLRLRSGEIY